MAKYLTGLDEILDSLKNSVIAVAAKCESSVCMIHGPGWSRKDNVHEKTLQLEIFRSQWTFLIHKRLKISYEKIGR